MSGVMYTTQALFWPPETDMIEIGHGPPSATLPLLHTSGLLVLYDDVVWFSGGIVAFVFGSSGGSARCGGGGGHRGHVPH